MSIAKLPFPTILGGRDVLIWSVTLPGLLVPAVAGPPCRRGEGLSQLFLLFYISGHLGLKKQESWGLGGPVTKQLPPLSWISLEFHWFFLNPSSCPLPWRVSKEGICRSIGISRFHIRQKLIFPFFFLKVDRWSDTGGLELTPCSLLPLTIQLLGISVFAISFRVPRDVLYFIGA